MKRDFLELLLFLLGVAAVVVPVGVMIHFAERGSQRKPPTILGHVVPDPAPREEEK